MTTVTISTDYDGSIESDGGSRDTTREYLRIGIPSKALVTRSFIRFPLGSLPAGAVVTDVKLKLNCTKETVAILLDVHPYNGDGQANPEDDAGVEQYNRCAAGTEYVNDDPCLQSTGLKTITLGGTILADVVASKTAVNRFSLGLHDEGDDCSIPISMDQVEALEHAGTDEPKLVITYTITANPLIRKPLIRPDMIKKAKFRR